MPKQLSIDPSSESFAKQVIYSALVVILAGIVIAIFLSAAFGIVIVLLGAVLGMGGRFKL